MNELFKSVALFSLLLVMASCAHSPDRYYFGNYSEAERLYSKGDYKKAIEKYKAYLNESPEGNLAVISEYYIGKSYAALGRTEDAKKAYNRVVEKHPDLVWANFAQNQLKELEIRGNSAKV